MENITAVTEFLRTKTDDPRGVLTLVKTTGGASYLHTQDGYWRVYDLLWRIPSASSFPRRTRTFIRALWASVFQQLLTDFPGGEAARDHPEFPQYTGPLPRASGDIGRDLMHRAAQVQSEIEFALARQAEMSAIQNALTAGELPLRVTHNDTKLNNVLLDAKTRKALCVIDLDTVMPLDRVFMTSAIPSALARQLPQRMKKTSPKWR